MYPFLAEGVFWMGGRRVSTEGIHYLFECFKGLEVKGWREG